MLLVATTTLLTGGICMASCSRVEPPSNRMDWLSTIPAAAACAMRRLASKLRLIRSSNAAAAESGGNATAPPCVFISRFLAVKISRSDRIVTSDTPNVFASSVVRAWPVRCRVMRML